MQQSYFQFSQIKDQKAIETMVEIVISGAFDNEIFQKEFCQKFISDLHAFLNGPNNAPKNKYYGMLVLKQVILKNQMKIIGLLSSSQVFLEYLLNIVQNTDPKKSVAEKGKKLFPQDKDGYGQKFVHLIAETLIFLGQSFPKTSKGEPTRFRKMLLKLQSENVNLPLQLTYYSKTKSKASKQTKKTEQKMTQKPQNTSTPTPESKPGEKKGTNIKSLLGLIKFKITEYLSELEEIQQAQQMQQIILRTHEVFKKQLSKFDEIQQTIYQEQPQTVEQYLKLRGFLEQQSETFNNQVKKNNQFGIYYSTIKIKYEQIFPNEAPRNSKINKKTDRQSKVAEPKPSIPNKSDYNSRQSKEQEPAAGNKGDRDQSRQSGSKVDPGAVIENLFEKIRQKSKSPLHNFREIQQSMEKERKNLQAHPPTRHTRSPIKVTASNLTRSAVSNSIFTNVPNPNPPYRNYQGQLLPSNKGLPNILYDIKKEQGHRRFKMSILKNKAPLFENESLQIGYKTEPVYEQSDGFNKFLSLELYFGNISPHQIRDLEISFQGDQKCLIYSNPREIASLIDSKQQLKHNLMIVPQSPLHSFTLMRLSYTCNSVPTHSVVALPNSPYKFCQNIQTTKTQFLSFIQKCSSVHRTPQFRLSHHLPPNMIRKYISNLSEFTSYSEFSMEGSEIDYELFCLVDLGRECQAAMKISIRPDLTVVLGVWDRGDCGDWRRGVLDALRFVLEEVSE